MSSPKARRSGAVGRRLVGAAAMSAALALAGCGAGLKYNDAVGRRAPPGTEAPFVAAGSGPPPPDAGSGSVRLAPVPLPPGKAPAPTPTATAFCRDMADIQGLIAALLQPGSTPTTASRALSLLERLKTDAPAELRPSLSVLVTVQGRVITDLSSTPINLADLSAALTDPAYRQSLQQVVVYAGQHCSINLTPPGP